MEVNTDCTGVRIEALTRKALKARRYRENNKDKLNEKSRKYYLENVEMMRKKAREKYLKKSRNGPKGYESFANWSLKKRYGITLEDKKAMIEEQGGNCKICEKFLDERKKTHVDHDHNTGHIRGILCNNCNQGIGIFKDNVRILERAVGYLKEAEIAKL